MRLFECPKSNLPQLKVTIWMYSLPLPMRRKQNWKETKIHFVVLKQETTINTIAEKGIGR